MRNLTIRCLPILFASLLAPGLHAQVGAGCPDTQATNMPVRVQHDGPYVRCGIGLQLFGVQITVGGAKCYRDEFIYPAHQECLGAANPGTMCVPEGTMPVKLEHCECLLVGALGTGISTPKCSCSDAGTAGTIEDAQTLSCHEAD